MRKRLLLLAVLAIKTYLKKKKKVKEAEATQRPLVNEGINKMWYKHTEHYSVLKKKEILAHALT